jgi:hypothetical protein
MAWYNSSWDYRVKVTIDKDEVPSNQTNFPVFVDLSDLPAGFFSNVKSDGGDIRVTQSNGTTEQAREVDWITTGSSIGEIHFKASSISSSVDTDFYIYYGNSGASDYAEGDTYGKHAVWDSNFLAVQHLSQDPSGSSPQMIDSTSNSADGTSGGTMTTGDLVTGKVGRAIAFDGTDDVISMDSAKFSSLAQAFTVECWVQYDADASGVDAVIWAGTSGAGGQDFIFYTNGNKTPKFRINNTGTEVSAGDCGTSWCYIAGTYDGSNIEVFKDGASVSSTGRVAGDIRNTSNTSLGAVTGGTSAGNIKQDEVRVSKIVRSANWIETCFNNQTAPGTFYTIGSQEEESVFVPKIIMF